MCRGATVSGQVEKWSGFKTNNRTIEHSKQYMNFWATKYDNMESAYVSYIREPHPL